ncbi:MAG: beta-galactosidase [Spirochaetota bacterium]
MVETGAMLMQNGLFLRGERIPLFGGEMHFWRINPEYWERCLRQLKAMGLHLVSTYLSWRRHSISPDENDLTGRTDPRLNLPAFLGLCAELGLWVHLKPGPWICAEEENGGYPDWLVRDEDIQVKNNQGRPVLGYNPPFSGPIPSYLHPQYLEYVHKWLTDVDSCIKDFCYPRGPIILVQLDNEPSMTFHDGMFESDYNSVNVQGFGFYQQWLHGKYGSIEMLNRAHGANYSGFSDAEAPLSLEVKCFGDLRRYTDWAEFKEWLLARYVEVLREIHLKNGIQGVLFTVNYNHHAFMSVPNNWSKLEQASGLGGYDYYAVPPLQHKDFVDFVKAVNYSLATLKIPWAPEMMCGIWRFEGSEEIDADLLAPHMEGMYFLSLAYGIKGINFYMLVNRENWQHAPVDERGRHMSTYSVLKKVMDFVKAVKDFTSLLKNQKVAVMYYRPYAWEAYITAGADVVLEGLHLGEAYRSFEVLYAALVELNYDPGIFDPFVNNERDISKYQLLFVSSSVYMDEGTQKLLRRYVGNGGILVFSFQLPHLDLDMKPCSHFDTNGKYVVSKFSAESKSCSKVLFVERNLGKGKVVVMETYLPCQEKDKKNGEYLEALGSLLSDHGLTPEVVADDRYIATIVQENDFEEILFVINMTSQSREVKLRFKKVTTGTLRRIFSQEPVLFIKNRETTLTMAGRGIEVFHILK